MTTIYKFVVPKRGKSRDYTPGSLTLSHPGHRIRVISAGWQDERGSSGEKTGESSIVVGYEATLGEEHPAQLHLFYTGDVVPVAGLRHLATLQSREMVYEMVYHLYT